MPAEVEAGLVIRSIPAGGVQIALHRRSTGHYPGFPAPLRPIVARVPVRWVNQARFGHKAGWARGGRFVTASNGPKYQLDGYVASQGGVVQRHPGQSRSSGGSMPVGYAPGGYGPPREAEAGRGARPRRPRR
jgi:hypothetical protein